jgi:hypothetical protein
MEPPDRTKEDPFLIPPTPEQRREWDEACKDCSEEYVEATHDFWDGLEDLIKDIWNAIIDFFEWLFGIEDGRSG